MLSPYRIPPNNTNKSRQKISNTNLDDNSHRERHVKRPQLTSNDLKRPQLTSNDPEVETVRSKNKLKGGANANIEINDNYSDETLHNMNL